jgi:hypothetical protein
MGGNKIIAIAILFNTRCFQSKNEESTALSGLSLIKPRVIKDISSLLIDNRPKSKA